MDKPGGDNLEMFARLRKACEERGLPFQMGYMFRNNPAMRWCLKASRDRWFGNILEIQCDMNHDYGGDDYQEYIGKFQGGVMFNLGCHLTDFVVALMGRPKNVTSFLKSAPGWPETVRNHSLAVLEYEHTLASLRVCSLSPGGVNARRLKISGDKGAVELSPLECYDGTPIRMNLTKLEGNEAYSAGTHIVEFGIKNDRYEDQLLELALMINGEMENPYKYEHDYLAQEVLLAAAGYTTWKNQYASDSDK
jgi:predicted dehydrogenase